MYNAAAAAAKLLQSCPTLCDPIGSSPPSSAVPGILHARTLEWGAIAFSMGTIKGRNGMDLTEAEDIKRGGKNTQKNFPKKSS